MKLKQLLTAIKYRAEQVPDVDITDLVYDSRKAVPGCAFVCLRGGVFSVKMTGTLASTISSAMMTAAPFSAAIFAYLWPSAFAPRRQTNAQPGTALRES